MGETLKADSAMTLPLEWQTQIRRGLKECRYELAGEIRMISAR